jgi:hypothetical protein
MPRSVYILGLAGLLTAVSSPAANFSFAGSFSFDTDVEFFSFTLANPTPNVTLRTWSYAGGMNAAGQTILLGGFESILNLYAPDGTGMNPGISGPCTVPLTGNAVADLLPDPATKECGDVYYPTTTSFPGGTWNAGMYTIALTENGNQGVGNLSDGFFASQVLGISVPGNFTCQEGPIGFQGSPPSIPVDQPFCDQFATGVQRNGSWSLDILNVDSAVDQSAAVPEPETWLSLIFGLSATAMAWRRRTFHR